MAVKYISMRRSIPFPGCFFVLWESEANLMRKVKVAAKLQAVIPVCFYERAGNKAFNSVAMIDADGKILEMKSVKKTRWLSYAGRI